MNWWTWGRASGCYAFRRPGCRRRKPSPSFAASRKSRPPRRFACAASFPVRRCRKAIAIRSIIFVNGRLIRDRLLLHAISSAYHNLMPAACVSFRAAVPRMRLRRSGRECPSVQDRSPFPPSILRARFHPRPDPGQADRIAAGAVLLAGSAASLRPFQQPAAQLPYSDFSQMLENEAPQSEAEPEPAADSVLPQFALRPTAAPAPRFDFVDAPEPALEMAEPAPGPRLRVPETHGEFPPEAVPYPESSLTALSDLRPLGQTPRELHHRRRPRRSLDHRPARGARAHSVRKGAEAARRRAAWNRSALLMPLILQLTAEQQIEYARIADELNAIGFETEPFGNRTIAVKAAPAAIATGRPGKGAVRNAGNRRRRVARRLDGRPPPRDRRFHRLPRGHQRSICGSIRKRWTGCSTRWPPPTVP